MAARAGTAAATVTVTRAVTRTDSELRVTGSALAAARGLLLPSRDLTRKPPGTDSEFASCRVRVIIMPVMIMMTQPE